MTKLYNFNINLLTTFNEGVLDFIDKIPKFLSLFGYEATCIYTVSTLESPCRIGLMDDDTFNSVISNWHKVDDYRPTLNVPVLFLYEGQVYSGYYYESEEDRIENTVSFMINVPDESECTGELLANPTHWMYVSDLIMPSDINKEN